MKREALVVRTEADRAVVSVLREEACASCSGRHVCGSAKETEIEVINNIGAITGDTVEIEAESKTMLAYTALLFLLPIILAVGVYLLLSAVSEPISYVGALIGFVLPYIVALMVDRSHAKLPIIVRIVAEQEIHGMCDSENADQKDSGT